MTPFITFYTPTYKRPQGLARCLASVAGQTAVDRIEQIVIPDHVGIGVGGMFSRVRAYAPAVHGKYVHFLCDDDVLAGPDVVQQVEAFAAAQHDPPLILVRTNKDGATWPAGMPWPPVCGQIDLNCGIVRADVWRRHVADYQAIYEGDFTFFEALHKAGVDAAYLPLLFSVGAVSRGAAEAA